MIARIREAFFAAQGEIAALSTRAYRAAGEGADRPALLGGVAAALGAPALARLLSARENGMFPCAACGERLEFIFFGAEMAVYPMPSDDMAWATGQSSAALDMHDGRPDRAACVLGESDARTPIGPEAQSVLDLAREQGDAESQSRIGCFLAEFTCPCGDATIAPGMPLNAARRGRR